ncbi:hypothetical protein EW146_g7782 [Bondarzewia mesenterica]|uniref:Vacuolar fusion protein MON1 n=1 Tax=Bondarzewia mesenterica TaxID=1095465 RepID=A0A4S4LK40_9AGAM|nr:hypothetical protein EW146_g7782 [Bondarzewia mesenterica]
MSRTPSSRTPSRTGTPLGQSPSKLNIVPSLRSSPSLSNLQVLSNAYPTTNALAVPQAGVESSASSMTNVDVNDGILVLETDAEVDVVDGEVVRAVGRSISDAGDEASKKALRDQLRRTLSQRDSSIESARRIRPKERPADVLEEVSNETVDVFLPRQYYVLTEAGKPVFTSRSVGHDPDVLASTIGIMQALISVFLDDNDKLRYINAGKTRINFLIRSPLYYACVSSWGEPESVTRSHLEYLHLQLLSVVSAAQLRRMFERRNNFDLGRLLNGAEVLIHSLLDRVEMDLAMSTSSLHCLKLDPSVRSRAASALIPSSRMKGLLYIILVGQGRVITLVRPRKHSIHPADLQILMNTAHSPSIVNSSASASWIPLCLPKFDPSGFVNAYITFLQEQSSNERASPTRSNPPDSGESDQGTSSGTPKDELNTGSAPSVVESSGFIRKSSGADAFSAIGLLCVSGNGDFESIRNWCDAVTKKLESDGTLSIIARSIREGTTEYSVSELSIPGLRHFIYKSRAHVQITAPLYEEPYDSTNEQRRLITLYQTLHDGIHARSGQGMPLKLQYIRTQKESVMGWITQPFELYIALSPWLPKSAAIGAANSVARWVKKEEARLFLRDAPVF